MPNEVKRKYILETDEEIVEFIENFKANELNKKVLNSNYGFHFDVKGAFEYHITVRINDRSDINKFVKLCKGIGLKPIFIELPYGEEVKQLMTSKYITGTYPDVLLPVHAIAHKVASSGFQILRIKIEALAANKGVPRNESDIAFEPGHRYFEFHFKIMLNDESEKERLTQIGQKYNAHTSRNAFKQFGNGKFSNFLTMRTFGKGRDEALKMFGCLKAELLRNGFEIIGHEQEYVVYDSNLDLDKGWVKKEKSGSGFHNELYRYGTQTVAFLCIVGSVYRLFTRQ